MKQLTETLSELYQTWHSRRYLLQQMSQQTFTIAIYLRQKQHALIDAMDEQMLKKGRQNQKGKKKRNTEK